VALRAGIKTLGIVVCIVLLSGTLVSPRAEGPSDDVASREEIAFLPAYRLAEMIRSKKVTSSEVVEIYLDRIARFNKDLNAMVTVDEKGARKRARGADEALKRGEVWGPLHGVPVTIKDNIATSGIQTTSGLKDLVGYVPKYDATLVERLKKAGAVILGKTNLPPMAMDVQTRGPLLGTANNPWDLACTTGGSSGGEAAAVAAGLTAMGFGNDIGGSIRIPAHFCGIYGLKPTENFTPGFGVAPGVRTGGVRSVRHMACSGPLARSIEDLRLGLSVIAGPDPGNPDVPWVDLSPIVPRDMPEIRVAWTDDFGGVPVTQETKDALRKLADRLAASGCRVERVQGGLFEHYRTVMREASKDLYRVKDADIPPADFESAWTTYGRLMDLELGMYQPSLFRLVNFMFGWWYRSGVPMISMAFPLSYDKYMKTLTQRDFFVSAMDSFFERYDVLVCPVSSTPAYRHITPWMYVGPYPVYTESVYVDDMPVKYLVANMSHTSVFNLTGNPVVVMPAGFTKDGLPIGVQVVGKRWRDMELLAIAEQIDRVSSSYRRPPGY